MAGFILGEKSEQTQFFLKDATRVPATFIKTSPCFLLDVKAAANHGYMAVKMAFGNSKNITVPAKGELKKAGIETPLRFFREFRLDKFADTVKTVDENGKKGIALADRKIFAGEEVKPDVFFKVGDLIDVSGMSKGKGFQGVVRRHHFRGGSRTHGQSDRERAPGAIGSTTTPGRINKGKRMAGRMGNDRVTVKNLEVLEIRDNGILVKGLVPGARGGLIEIRSVV